MRACTRRQAPCRVLASPCGTLIQTSKYHSAVPETLHQIDPVMYCIRAYGKYEKYILREYSADTIEEGAIARVMFFFILCTFIVAYTTNYTAPSN